MKMRLFAMCAVVALLPSALEFGTARARAQVSPTNELPRQTEIPGITPEVLVRADVPGVPGKKAIVTRVTYQPGARIRKHYHTSQIVFYILAGSMMVQDEGKEPVQLKVGDSLLIKPGTTHVHWNASTTAPLVFTEFILVDDGQRSAVFVE